MPKIKGATTKPNAVSGNAYRVVFKRIRQPLDYLTVIVIALNFEEAARKVKDAWRDDFSHFSEITALNLRGIA